MADVNYGRDLSCTDGLRTGRYVTGARLLAEACYRRLTTPRGMLRGGEEEANYGLDLSAEIGTTGNPGVLAASLAARVRNELLKDERILDVIVDVVPIVTGPLVELLVDIRGRGAKEGPFALQLSVTEARTALVSILGEAA